MNDIIRRLAETMGRTRGVPAGRATSALTAGLRALRLAGKVLLPAVSNPAPSVAVRLAGLEPVFADVKLSDGTLCPKDVERALIADPAISAVIAIDLYGQPCDWPELARVCAAAKVHLIEDAAQALGGTLDGRPLGAFGVFSIVSFGHSKILDVGEGGALLCDDAGLEREAASHILKMPKKPADWAAQMEKQRKLHYELTEKRDLARLARLYEEFPNNYLFQAGDAAPDLDSLPRVLSHRRKLAAIYAKVVEPLESLGEPAWWRYSFRVPAERRAALLDGLRASGFDASSWYPCLASRRTAERFSEEIVNLWTAPATTEERAAATARRLRELLEGSHA